MFLLFLFCTTKIGEISDIAKCFENFVSQTLGFLTSFYAAELRNYSKMNSNGFLYNVDKLKNMIDSALTKNGMLFVVNKNVTLIPQCFFL